MKKLALIIIFLIATAGPLLADPHAYPVPCVVPRDGSLIHFVELPGEGTIKIFTVAGEEVAALNIPASAGIKDWLLTNHEGKKVATGVYLYLIDGGGEKTRGKIIVIR